MSSDFPLQSTTILLSPNSTYPELPEELLDRILGYVRRPLPKDASCGWKGFYQQDLTVVARINSTWDSKATRYLYSVITTDRADLLFSNFSHKFNKHPSKLALFSQVTHLRLVAPPLDDPNYVPTVAETKHVRILESIYSNWGPLPPDFQCKCGMAYRFCRASRTVIEALTGVAPIRGFPYAHQLFHNLQGLSCGLLNYPDADWEIYNSIVNQSTLVHRDNVENAMRDLWSGVRELVLQLHPAYFCSYPHVGPYALAHYWGSGTHGRFRLDDSIVTKHMRFNYGSPSPVRGAINRIALSRDSWGDHGGLHHKSSFECILRSIRTDSRHTGSNWCREDHEVWDDDPASWGWDDESDRRIKWWEEEVDWVVDFERQGFEFHEFVGFKEEHKVQWWDLEEDNVEKEDSEDGDGDNEDRPDWADYHERGDCRCHPDEAWLDNYWTKEEQEPEDDIRSHEHDLSFYYEDYTPKQYIEAIGRTTIEVYGMFANPVGHDSRTSRHFEADLACHYARSTRHAR